MDILIPIETASRELLYKTYICHLLALRGFNCYLGNKTYITYLMMKMKSYIYLDKGYHKDVSDNLYKIVKQQRGYIVSLDEEGGVDYHDNSTLLGRYSKNLFEVADLVFMWGEDQNNIVEKNITDQNKVIVSGHPRFELLKSEYRYLYQREVNSLQKRFGDFILINTNMGFGNNIKGDKFIIDNYGGRFKNIKDIISFDKQKMESIVSLIKKMSSCTNKVIVLRPHPEENINFYISAFQGLKNVHVIYEGSVIPWLLAAEIMIHPDCTTSIESLLLGKKAISFLPEKYDSDLVTKLPLEASYRFNNEDAVISFIVNKSYFSEEVNLTNYEFVEEYFSFSKNSSKLIVDKIAELILKNKSYASNNLFFKDKVYFLYKSLRSKLAQNNSAKLSKNKLKGFNYNEIDKIHKKMINMDTKFAKVIIKKYSNNLSMFKSI